MPRIIDQLDDISWVLGSMSCRTSTDRRPVRNATRTASMAAGTSSKTERDALMAAAANEPVQRPTTKLLE